MAENQQLLAVLGPDLSAEQLHRILAVRTAVFVVEQNCPYQEVDGPDLDPGTTHLWIEDEHGIASYLRILSEDDVARIGRVLTREDQRRTGVSSKLMAVAIERIGARVSVLSAQTYLTGYYERFGYEATGPEFIEDGIPHVPMRREAHQDPQRRGAHQDPQRREAQE